jgi:hypothetical protein
MTALFIPLPFSPHCQLVRTLAVRMAAAVTSNAKSFFQGRVARLLRGPCCKRMLESVIERELRALEAAVGGELRAYCSHPRSLREVARIHDQARIRSGPPNIPRPPAA